MPNNKLLFPKRGPDGNSSSRLPRFEEKSSVFFCITVASHLKPLGILETGDFSRSPFSVGTSCLVWHKTPVPNGRVPGDVVPGCAPSFARHRLTPLENTERFLGRLRQCGTCLWFNWARNRRQLTERRGGDAHRGQFDEKHFENSGNLLCGDGP